MVKITKTNKALIFIFSLVLAILFSVSVNAITASIGNARMVLYPIVVPGESTLIEKYIAVNNINDVDIKVDLKPSEGFEQYVSIIDDSFVLKPTEYKNARFTINISQFGRYEGKILVTFLPVDEMNSSAVGLASNILIIAKESGEQNLENLSSDINASELVEQNPDELSKNNKITIIAVALSFIVLASIVSFYFYKKKIRGKKNE